jgi:hypothetical protein
LSPIGNEDSGLKLEPEYSTVEISEQMELTVNSTLAIFIYPNSFTASTNLLNPPSVIEATAEEGIRALEENEEDLFVIDSMVPLRSNIRAKQSHSSSLSSAIVTEQFQTGNSE